MYGRGLLGARRFCKECIIDPFHMKAFLSFGSNINLTTRERVWEHWKKIIHKGGGREAGTFGGKLPPPPLF